MFTELSPLLAERRLIITLEGKPDGKVVAYVQPKQKAGENDAEAGAFLTPFVVTATAEELDAQLPAALTEWVAVRQGECASVQAALAAATAQVKASADAAKAAAAQKAKGKTVVPPAKPAKPAAPVASAATLTPSAMDEEDEDAPGEAGGNAEVSAGGSAGAAPAGTPAGASAAVLTTTDSLFGDD